MSLSGASLEVIGWWIVAVMGVVLSAMASGVEIGCYSLNRVRLAVWAGRHPPVQSARALLGEIERPDRLLATLLVCNMIANDLGSVATRNLLEGAGYTHATQVLFNVLILGPVLFVFGEAVPKELFRVEADRLTYLFARPLKWFRWALTIVGVLPLVAWFGRATERLSGLSGDESALSDPRQRIAELLREGGTSGVLSETQLTLVDRAMALRRTSVADELVPWTKVKPVFSDWDRPRLLLAMADVPHSRVPVVDRKGKVVGVLRQIDLHTQTTTPVASLLRSVTRLDPGMSVFDALKRMRDEGSRLAVVERDGRPIGLVTPKDLVESLTGELADW